MKFDCQPILDSPSKENNSSNSLQIHRKMLTPGLEPSIWNDDLTRHAVDAVENAANENLLHKGLTFALVEADGQEIQQGSMANCQLVRQMSRVHRGFLANAVGPQWWAEKREGNVSGCCKLPLKIF